MFLLAIWGFQWREVPSKALLFKEYILYVGT